jgi:CheY-like chemotaxis protein
VAHDLNNILSGIVSYPDLLLMDIEADSPLRQPLLRIKRSGQKAAEIVQDLLTLARRNVATKKVINLSGLVTTFLVSPEYRQIVADRPHIDIETELATEMLNVMGSETHLSKSVMNLVANAADAMPSGGTITISTRDCYIGKGESILIVDDAAEQRNLAGRMMQRLGYQVTLAPSGEAALEWIDKQHFDLLILDMIMPSGMDGLQTYKAVLQKVPDQKAIIAIGFAQTDSVHEAQRLGAGSYVKKPYTLERIGTAVRKELDR